MTQNRGIEPIWQIREPAFRQRNNGGANLLFLDPDLQMVLMIQYGSNMPTDHFV